MTMAMVTPPMPVHPDPRFGIGVIPIRGITLRYPNARSLGDKLFSKRVGHAIGLPANRNSPLLTSPCGPPFLARRPLRDIFGGDRVEHTKVMRFCLDPVGRGTGSGRNVRPPLTPMGSLTQWPSR
jgi:hypothetical protein